MKELNVTSDECIETFINILQKEFGDDFEVLPIFSIYGPLKWINFVKVSRHSPKKHYKQLMANKAGDKRNRFHALQIRWRGLGTDCNGYGKTITVEGVLPICKTDKKDFKWDNIYNWNQYGYPCSSRTINKKTMMKIVKYIKTLI